MKSYHNLIKNLLRDPKTQVKPTRSGVYAISRFGNYNEYDLSKGFPLITTRKINFNIVATELLWFLRGETNLRYLHEHNVHIWDKWADHEGNLGRVYGAQWCDWKNPKGESINQIQNLIQSIKEDPYSKRHIVNAWNPGELNKMALPPCHIIFQFNVNPDKTLDCHLFQRAADVGVGLIYNLASYSLLTNLVARETNLAPGRFIHSIGDIHIYCGKGERGQYYKNNFEKLRDSFSEKNFDYQKISSIIENDAPAEEFDETLGRTTKFDHIPGLLKLLCRKPSKLPQLEISSKKSLFNLSPQDVSLINYIPHSPIKFDVAL